MFFFWGGNCLFKKGGMVYLLEDLSTLRKYPGRFFFPPTVFSPGKLDDIHPFIGFFEPSLRRREIFFWGKSEEKSVLLLMAEIR